MVDNEITHNLIAIGAKFAKLNKDKTAPELWEVIFDNNLYEVNELMLEQYFSKDDFWNRSYTYISQKESMKEYINNNLDKYIPIILGHAQNSENRFFDDDEELTIEILNNENISRRDKRSYIANMLRPISNISDVYDTELWNSLLEHRSVQASEDTIVKYFNNNTDNSDSKNNKLMDFMNGIDDLTKLDFNETIWNKYPDIKERFYKLILSSTRLTKSAESIVRSAKNIKFDLQEIPNKVKSEYVKIMLEEGTLLMTDKNVQEIVHSYFDYINLLIIKNCDTFCKYLKNRSVVLDEDKELSQILKDGNHLPDNQKIKIIRAYPDRIKYTTLYSTEILTEILDDHYVPSKLHEYFEVYKYANNTQKLQLYEALKKASNIRDYRSDLERDYPDLYKKLVNDNIL